MLHVVNKVQPRYSWDDIVLPDETLTQLREICRRVEQRRKVARDLRGGATALFLGPSGTGKTMAAEVIATDLALDLYHIDLAGAASKYIGETEKNLKRVFDQAQDTSAILLFDEADALFGKRSEVHDSHNRYANIEVSYLLQKIEAYEGIAILASNSGNDLDDAFVRRLTFTVCFPIPDPDMRLRIWDRIWPPDTSLARDVDHALLAERFELTGGNIRNIAVAAAFFAAERSDAITMENVLNATRREYEKMGRSLSDDELKY